MKLRFRKQKAPFSSEQQLERLRKSPLGFLGVQIHPCSCRASSKYAGKIFSFKTVPGLPVPGCEAIECHCQYRGTTDRRRGVDRRRRLALVRPETSKPKRRIGVDRRKGGDIWKGFDD